MEKTPLIIAVLIAVVSLVALNPGFRTDKNEMTHEISRAEYAKLQTTLNLYTEIADTAKEELNHDTVTFAEYNKIMRKVDKLTAKQDSQRTAARFLAH